MKKLIDKALEIILEEIAEMVKNCTKPFDSAKLDALNRTLDTLYNIKELNQ